MVKHVWKELKIDDMAVVTDYLAQLPSDVRPLYAVTGIKTSVWSQIGGGAKPFVVLFMPDRIILSKRSTTGKKEVTRTETPINSLADVSVRHGPLVDSARFAFNNGYNIRVGQIAHTQIEPVERFMEIGDPAFDWDRLTREQRTNCYYAFTMMGILPRDLL